MHEGGRLLSRWLDARQTNQVEFARISGISQAAVSKLISGRSVPSLAHAMILNRHCSIPFE